jgi:hypothetical protein
VSIAGGRPSSFALFSVVGPGGTSRFRMTRNVEVLLVDDPAGLDEGSRRVLESALAARGSSSK